MVYKYYSHCQNPAVFLCPESGFAARWRDNAKFGVRSEKVSKLKAILAPSRGNANGPLGSLFKYYGELRSSRVSGVSSHNPLDLTPISRCSPLGQNLCAAIIMIDLTNKAERGIGIMNSCRSFSSPGNSILPKGIANE